MPLPILVLATAQAAVTAGTSIWVYIAGGTGAAALGGGGIYYYRDSIYNWWYPKPCEMLPENDFITKQSNIIQDVRNGVVQTQAKIEKKLEDKDSIVIDVKQNAKKTEEVVTEVQNITVPEKETFESLLKKITEGKSERLDNVLIALEQTKDTLTFSQVETIQSILKIVKENQLLREVDAKKDKIILKLEKINSILQQKLTRITDSMGEGNSSNIGFRKN